MKTTLKTLVFLLILTACNDEFDYTKPKNIVGTKWSLDPESSWFYTNKYTYQLEFISKDSVQLMQKFFSTNTTTLVEKKAYKINDDVITYSLGGKSKVGSIKDTTLTYYLGSNGIYFEMIFFRTKQ